MNKQQTITINGVHYDAHTGLRLKTPTHHTIGSAARQATSPAAHNLHARTNRSVTLNRKHVAAPASKTKVRPVAVSQPRTASTTHPSVSKFGSKPHHAVTSPANHHVKRHDIAPVAHPAHAAATARQAALKQRQASAPQPKPARVQKHEAIEKALHNARATHKQHRTAKKPGLGRFTSVASASLALVLLAGYFTYVNLPNLSVRVAAAQAGINASYPGYRPVGYHIDGPVAFSDGRVSMTFLSNTSPKNFHIVQAESDWDSAALRDNLVVTESNGNYNTITDNGLTIYVYGTSAAWMDGGLLHTISGETQLTNNQISSIATSM